MPQKPNEVNISNQLVVYSDRKEIPSVVVDKDLLENIESYLRKFLSDHFSVPQELVDAKYTTVIHDTGSKLKFGLIENHEGKLFPDRLNRIEIILRLREHSERIDLLVRLTFSRIRGDSEIFVEIRDARPKDRVNALITGIKEVLNEKGNANYLFHPNSFWNAILLGILFLWWIGIMIFADLKNYTALKMLIGFSIIIPLTFLLSRLKPYCAFDTPLQKKNDFLARFILAFLILGIVLNITANFLIKFLSTL